MTTLKNKEKKKDSILIRFRHSKNNISGHYTPIRLILIGKDNLMDAARHLIKAQENSAVAPQVLLIPVSSGLDLPYAYT